MLVLVAFDLSWVRGIPADVADVGGTLPQLIRRAETGDHHGRRPSAYEVCEIWQLADGVRPDRVARRQPGFIWVDRDGLLLDDVRQWTFISNGSPPVVEPLPDQVVE